MKGLKDKVVLVTGGAGGIGSAICRRFAEAGSTVAVFDLNSEATQKLANDLEALGVRARGYKVDITDHDAVNAAVTQVEDELGPIDVLVNNAGWDIGAFFLQTEKPFWDKVVAINLYGPLNMHHAVLKRMSARGTGRVVNISSDAGRVGSSMEAVYSFCKGGLIAFSKTMAREMSRQQIPVNVVCPGPTETALLDNLAQGEKGEKIKAGLVRAVPFGRMGQPDDVAGMVLFLSSDDAAFITGQVISVSGGLTMVG
ncbi:2-hydroxycyclohexanecarboxyl-CoA dehydrogenase [Pseudomonas sp. SJZ103]|uniref:glucose 1-dehydrogenase n=1 Tax=unclassified Pseudomonas TaxID=196821 RepID=UPI0011A279F0|nr:MULTISPECIES: glucose 1-dehydrogenase [unclassified Pseudomonas]MBB6290751.1 2-hydroxycyclohexanecarboxyl-CoA dehydrogenase [Pseudomonas sp. SJZ073]MBB6315521.1 2-hydroxycyclohexanecarboxyl-CoA dehydrogenase [Pseudomonas sp. JAI120]TWC61542.1 2-hydroxycyclohexanecarboxyl-CoA dehydrogenase [Pseudomonas sp. SJZ103]TWC78738.1 2-hydroxycyclohexanecarboxyl-CoA dehydrogenase [Pseudomonas sp. SJZ094]